LGTQCISVLWHAVYFAGLTDNKSPVIALSSVQVLLDLRFNALREVAVSLCLFFETLSLTVVCAGRQLDAACERMLRCRANGDAGSDRC